MNKSGFEAIDDGDLILCVTLLLKDARSYEGMTKEPIYQEVIRDAIARRRDLADRLKKEFDRRMADYRAVAAQQHS